jgi:DNA repair protein RadC
VGEEVGRWLLADYGGRLNTLVLRAAEPGCGYSHPGLEKIEAARELVRLALLEDLGERAALSSPSKVREYLRLTLEARGYEVFMVLFLDAQNRLLAAEEMFRGSLSQTSVYPREVVKAALAHNASAVILAHNHPSGIAEPSRADECITQQLRQALALVDIKVLDHFIVGSGPGQVMSFAERGLL